MKTKVYLDTSVVSALFDERTPERLTMTSNFWSKLSDYEVFISELVVEELEKTSVQIKDLELYSPCKTENSSHGTNCKFKGEFYAR